MQLTHMAKELVKELILTNRLSPDEARALLHETHATLQGLAAGESPAVAQAPEAAEVAQVLPDWKKSITKHAVTCLECGETFKQLSSLHLRVHNLDPRSYRRKYGIPRTQALSGRDMTRRRKELAQQIKPWEQAPHQQAKAQAAAQDNKAARKKAPA